MTQAIEQRTCTCEECLEFEVASEQRHEADGLKCLLLRCPFFAAPALHPYFQVVARFI